MAKASGVSSFSTLLQTKRAAETAALRVFRGRPTSLLEDVHLGADLDPLIEFDHVGVHHADAARGYGATN